MHNDGPSEYTQNNIVDEEAVLAKEQQRSIVYPILSVLIFIACLVINYTEGKNTGKVMRMKVTPPGYFFSIWAVIFSTTGGSLLYLCFRRHWTNEGHMYIWGVSICAAAWIIATASSLNGKVFLMFALLVSLVICVFEVWRRNLEQNYEKTWKYLLISNIYAFFLGWASSASVLNFVMMLIYGFGMSQDSGPYVFYPVAAIVISSFLTYAYKTKGLNSFVGYFISAGWALTGVTIAINTPRNDYPS